MAFSLRADGQKFEFVQYKEACDFRATVVDEESVAE